MAQVADENKINIHIIAVSLMHSFGCRAVDYKYVDCRLINTGKIHTDYLWSQI